MTRSKRTACNFTDADYVLWATSGSYAGLGYSKRLKPFPTHISSATYSLEQSTTCMVPACCSITTPI
ncbi:Hypothetical protein PHPALM_20742 [Phytophthora palmivora]|uniref:Uncharacterized protein n=1 Tax=Phytophthora palmivora TaxID=4796 RepID=A0A2P4XE31_9STRA|nr:Hypothetical protein PHPALM_20742 [Phytophthora palmivora]